MNSNIPLTMDHKIAVMGASRVGKTSLLRAFFEQPFVTEHKPTVDDYYVHGMKLDGVYYNVCIADTSGTYSFPVMRRFAISHCRGFIVMYSINDISSFQTAIERLDEIIELLASRYRRVPVLLVANKLDCNDERKISAHEAKDELHIRPQLLSVYTEVSSKTGVGVEGIFQSLINMMQAVKDREADKRRSSSKRKKT